MERRERGQVLPLVAVVMVLAGVACVAAGRLGSKAVAEAGATTAADAAALAGAAEGREAAGRIAAANGAVVAEFERLGADTRVRVVSPAGAQASARARRAGGPSATEGAPAPALRAALARAGQLLGAPVPVGAPAAGAPLPGDSASRHARGLAVDVAASVVASLAAVAAGAGLCQPYPDAHPVHFELCPYRLP